MITIAVGATTFSRVDTYICQAATQHSDYFCRVIEDCVAGSGEDAHEAALQAMEYLQEGARRSLGEVLDAMEEYEELSSVAA